MPEMSEEYRASGRRDNDRMIVLLMWLPFCAALILLDSAGVIDCGKWGYAAIFSSITFILTFFFRTSGDKK